MIHYTYKTCTTFEAIYPHRYMQVPVSNIKIRGCLEAGMCMDPSFTIPKFSDIIFGAVGWTNFQQLSLKCFEKDIIWKCWEIFRNLRIWKKFLEIFACRIEPKGIKVKKEILFFISYSTTFEQLPFLLFFLTAQILLPIVPF